MVPSTPETRGEVEPKTGSTSPGPGEQTGRFYRGDDPLSAVEQAALAAAPGPSKQEIRDAKKAQTAAAAAASTGAGVTEVPNDVVEAAAENAGEPPLAMPSGNASRGEWADYARSRGATEEELEGQSRNDLRDRYQLL